MTSDTPVSEIFAGLCIIIGVFAAGFALGLHHEAKIATERGFLVHNNTIYDVEPRHE